MADYLSWSYLGRRARLELGGLCVKGGEYLAELEKDAGIQHAPRPNPSPRPQSGRGLRGDVETEPAGLNPQQMKTDSSHNFNCV